MSVLPLRPEYAKSASLGGTTVLYQILRELEGNRGLRIQILYTQYWHSIVPVPRVVSRVITGRRGCENALQVLKTRAMARLMTSAKNAGADIYFRHRNWHLLSVRWTFLGCAMQLTLIQVISVHTGDLRCCPDRNRMDQDHIAEALRLGVELIWTTLFIMLNSVRIYG